ncbi:MAG TPA: hypothetical protein VMV71_03120 [Candidatus Paceibacterota bacterium]|nr:hypothetical protein [Candidatus Paceibacterota bacterium]
MNEARRRSVEVIDLEKEKATRDKVESYLKKKDPDIIIFNGHGNDVSVAGDDDKTIAEVGRSTYLFKDKKVYVRACRAGKKLGPDIVNNGATGFVGYIQDFIFPYDKDSIHKPLQDEYAKPNLECSNQVGISLIKGKSIKDANDDSLKMFKQKLDEQLTSKSKNSLVATCLLWNMMNQIVIE